MFFMDIYFVLETSKNHNKTIAFQTLTQSHGQPPIFSYFPRKKHSSSAGGWGGWVMGGGWLAGLLAGWLAG